MKSEQYFRSAESPEAVGISSQAIIHFLDEIEYKRLPMHGMLLIRKNQVVCEGYWAPYTADSLHRMYSISKSFVSLAVGLLIDEGKLRLNDRAADFFQDELPQPLHPYLARTTIRDLLIMATPHSENAYGRDDPDWLQAFFQKEPSHPPGTIFAYDTAATVVLTTIAERISGKPFLEYMRPALLDPLGFSKQAWCIQTPEGSSWGGSGVLCTLRDMAKVALLCLNEGRWNQKQLISREYIQQATSRQIDNSHLFDKHGYGYQIWRLRENGFAFIGMGSQLALCFPDQQFIFACTADTQGLGETGTGIVEAMWKHLYPSLSSSALPPDTASTRLNDRLNNLAILPQPGLPDSVTAERVSGVWYKLAANPMQITRLRLIFSQEEGCLAYTSAQGDHSLRFGLGKQVMDTFPQNNYFGYRIGRPAGKGYKYLASAAWVEPAKLNLLVYIIDHYLGTLKITLAFSGDEIGVYMTKAAEWFLDEYEGFAGGHALPTD